MTGGNSGIGYALCRQLAGEDGCHVYLGARSEAKGNAAVSQILDRHPGAKIEAIVIDVASDKSVTAAAATFKAQNIKLYGLCNNAGVGLSHGVGAEEIMNVNLGGVKRMCEAFIPILDDYHGRIVNTGSGIFSCSL